MAGNVVIFDTSVLIDDLRTGCHEERIQSVHGIIRTSSVVLAELWRGATTRQEHKFLEVLARNYPILTPTENNWLDSGRILAKIHARKHFDPNKLRDLHFDVLIALTTRTHGARLITSNRTDFETIKTYRSFDLEIW